MKSQIYSELNELFNLLKFEKIKHSVEMKCSNVTINEQFSVLKLLHHLFIE